MYADVILPLPLYASFTYQVPEEMLPSLSVGCRVLVQFGRSKIYTGIVEHIHAKAPDFEAKPILAQLDDKPVLRHPQLKFWHWISEYYLCSPGEVMKAALPAALKIESETWIEAEADPEPDELEALTERQAETFAYISTQKKVRISQLEKALKLTNGRLTVNRLMEKGLVRVAETVTDKYVSKK